MDNIKGILFVIISSICFGILPILAKLCYIEGMPTYTVLFLRFTIASLILLFILVRKKKSLKLKKNEVIAVLILGVFGYAVTATFLFMSYKYISVGLSTIILYTYPVLVAIIAYFIYKEQLSINKIISLLLSFFGIIILTGIGNSNLNLKGIILAFLSSIFYTIYVIGVSSKTVKSMDVYIFTFYISLISAITTMSLGIITNTLYIRINYFALIYISLMAVISTVLALMAFIKGVNIIGPSKASIFSTLEPIVSVAFGAMILNEKINYNTVIGGGLVLLSIIVLTMNSINKK